MSDSTITLTKRRKLQGATALICFIAIPFVIPLLIVLSKDPERFHSKKDVQCGGTLFNQFAQFDHGSKAIANVRSKVDAPEGQKECPDNACCSRYGYCGKTLEYCGLGW